jgi:metallo-beta-lactamase family protein
MRWLGGFIAPPAATYLVHGEPVALEALRARVTEEKQWPVHVAGYQQRVEI